MRKYIASLIALMLAACTQAPQPANPAFWEITGQHGEKAWLLGTIHALPRPVAWRSSAIDQAFSQADVVAVEVAELNNSPAVAGQLAKMTHSQGLPPLSQRVPADLRDKLSSLITKAKARESDFGDVETWATALTLARAGQTQDNSANGIDRAVLAMSKGKQVVEFEGAVAQLSLFDSLPENEQRDLLAFVVREGGQDAEEVDLANAWRKGDFALIERESHRGMLADKELRAVLFTARNQAWLGKIEAMLAKHQHPFIAVGAAHMAGSDGLVAMLQAKGYTVKRLQ